MSKFLPNSPTFICIGPGRSGTSWLFEIFLEHPEICMAKIKEVEFFNTNWDKGPNWYFKHFQHCCDNARASGEISNRYYLMPNGANRIKSLLPDVKIIACIRNPYDLLISTYFFDIRQGANWESLESALNANDFFMESVQLNKYLKPYKDIFGDNFYVMEFDRLNRDPERLASDIYSFIGVDPAFKPSVLSRVVNEAIVPKHPLIGRFAKGVAHLLRRNGLYEPLTYLKRNELVKQVFFKHPANSDSGLLTENVRRILDPVLQPDIRKLAQWTESRNVEAWAGQAK